MDPYIILLPVTWFKAFNTQLKEEQEEILMNWTFAALQQPVSRSGVWCHYLMFVKAPKWFHTSFTCELTPQGCSKFI